MSEYEDILLYEGGMSDGEELYELDDNELKDAGWEVEEDE
jgi:hypothetical protein